MMRLNRILTNARWKFITANITKGYVNKLNAAVGDDHALADQSIEDLLHNIKKVPMKIRQAVIKQWWWTR